MKAQEKIERKAEKLAARQLAKVQEAERRAARKAKKRHVVTGGGSAGAGAGAGSSSGGGGGMADERNGSKKARNLPFDETNHDLDDLQSDGYSTASTDATDAHPELGFANTDGVMRIRKQQRKHKVTIQSPSSSSSSSDGTITDISKDETVQPR